jgi:hypothetical protein
MVRLLDCSSLRVGGLHHERVEAMGMSNQGADMTQPEALRLADALEDTDSADDHDDAAAELRRLHAENEALRRNDARYRWLRCGDNDEKVLHHYISVPDNEGDPTMYLPRNEQLDTAIDAAMAQESKS